MKLDFVGWYTYFSAQFLVDFVDRENEKRNFMEKILLLQIHHCKDFEVCDGCGYLERKHWMYVGCRAPNSPPEGINTMNKGSI